MQLRDYQLNAINGLYSYFANRSGNPLVVVPTGGGKSLIIAFLIKDIISKWPNQRIIMLTHSKELIEQNHKELKRIWKEAPVGINSASVGRRERSNQIIFAGIQSVYQDAFLFDPFDLMIIDEAHLVSRRDNTMYRRFIKQMTLNNPKLKIIGLTATHYRLDSGLLHEGKDRLFTDIAYEVPVKLLINSGYLVPLISKGSLHEANFNRVKTQAGDFKNSEGAKAIHLILDNALKEVIEYGNDRKKWLLFTHNVESAIETSDKLNALGIAANAIHGSMKKDKRESILADYRHDKIKALVNCQVLTTGFNQPEIDLIVMLRGTKSTGLYIQMLGRGMRTAEGKKNCLVLDYAGNIERHGPVDTIEITTIQDKGEEKKIAKGQPTKECPDCSTIVSIFSRECPDCGYKFQMFEKPKYGSTASSGAILSEQIKPHKIAISGWNFSMHVKRIGEDVRRSVRVRYYDKVGLVCSEFLCFEHKGYAKTKALEWLKEHVGHEQYISLYEDRHVDSCDDMLGILIGEIPLKFDFDNDKFIDVNIKRPSHLWVIKRGKYFEITGKEFHEEKGEDAA